MPDTTPTTPEQQLIDGYRYTYAQTEADHDRHPTQAGFIAWLAASLHRETTAHAAAHRRATAFEDELRQAYTDLADYRQPAAAQPADAQLGTLAVAAWAALLRQAEDDRDAAQALARRYASERDHARQQRDQAHADLATTRAVAQSNQRHTASYAAELERYRPVVDAARAWRAVDPGRDVAAWTEKLHALRAAVDALGQADAASVPPARAHEPDAELLGDLDRADRWMTASGIPIDDREVPGWLDNLGIPVPTGIRTLLHVIRTGIISAGEAGWRYGQQTATAPAPDPDRIAQAIGDPGSIVGPRHLTWRDGGDVDGEHETVTRWATRAVLAVLAESAGKGLPCQPRDTDTPPQGDRIGGDDHSPQTPAQPAAPWEHWDADGDSITIRPLGRHLLATTTNYGPSDVGAAIDLNPDAAASLHAWLGTALGQPAPSTPDAAEPGPQDIPAEWMRAILHDATTLDDLDVADTELLTHHRAQGYRTAIRTAYGVGYASALGYQITVEDDLVLIGDRPEQDDDGQDDAPLIEAMLAQHRDDYAQAETDQERAEILGDLLADWYAAWPDTATADPHQPIAQEILRIVDPGELIADTEPSPAETRAQALAAATHLMTSAELDLPNALVRDLEQITIGMADRMAEWIATGDYDWIDTTPADAVLLTEEITEEQTPDTEEHHGRPCAHCGDPIHHDGHCWRHITSGYRCCPGAQTEATPS